MAENWDFALSFCTGDYICYLTDKMFLLPGTLKRANTIIQKISPEILNWTDLGFYPTDERKYFGSGHYSSEHFSSRTDNDFELFSPKEELSKKTKATVSRYEQNKSEYVRGKICFGVYSSKLIRSIKQKTQKLFFDISPDYTSMILGLSFCKTAVEMKAPGIAHVHTNVSHGGQLAIDDHKKLMYLSKLDSYPELMSNMLVPNLYSSTHNGVTSDYINISNKFGLGLKLDKVNWLLYISEDLDLSERRWSSKKFEREQRKLLQNYIDHKLTKQQRRKLLSKIEARLKDKKSKINLIFKSKQILKKFLPYVFILKYRSFLGNEKFMYDGQTFIKIEQITDLIIEYDKAD